jgi:hypothetical protein
MQQVKAVEQHTIAAAVTGPWRDRMATGWTFAASAATSAADGNGAM